MLIICNKWCVYVSSEDFNIFGRDVTVIIDGVSMCLRRTSTFLEQYSNNTCYFYSRMEYMEYERDRSPHQLRSLLMQHIQRHSLPNSISI